MVKDSSSWPKVISLSTIGGRAFFSLSHYSPHGPIESLLSSTPENEEVFHRILWKGPDVNPYGLSIEFNAVQYSFLDLLVHHQGIITH